MEPESSLGPTASHTPFDRIARNRLKTQQMLGGYPLFGNIRLRMENRRTR